MLGEFIYVFNRKFENLDQNDLLDSLAGCRYELFDAGTATKNKAGLSRFWDCTMTVRQFHISKECWVYALVFALRMKITEYNCNR